MPSSKRYRKGLQPAQRGRFPPCQWPGHRQARVPAKKQCPRQSVLHPREWCSQTKVDAKAEGDVAIVTTSDVQAIGVREVRRIAVGRTDRSNDHRTLRDLATVDLNLGVRNACRPLHRTVVA